MVPYMRKCIWLNPLVLRSNILHFFCKLHKVLCGLKQALMAWYEKLNHALVQFGFTNSKCDSSIFTYSHQGVILYALIYVDDILITNSFSTLVHKLIESLHGTLALNKLDIPKYFLGIVIKHLSTESLLPRKQNIFEIFSQELTCLMPMVSLLLFLTTANSINMDHHLVMILTYIVPWYEHFNM